MRIQGCGERRPRSGLEGVAGGGDTQTQWLGMLYVSLLYGIAFQSIDLRMLLCRPPSSSTSQYFKRPHCSVTCLFPPFYMLFFLLLLTFAFLSPCLLDLPFSSLSPPLPHLYLSEFCSVTCFLTFSSFPFSGLPASPILILFLIPSHIYLFRSFSATCYLLFLTFANLFLPFLHAFFDL